MSNDGTGLREQLEALATAMYADGDEWNAYDLLMDAAAALSAVAPPPVLEGPIRRAVYSADLYGVLMDVQNGIDSPGLRGMANNAIRLIDSARAALAASPAAPAQPGVEGWVLVPRDVLRTEAERLRYRATEACGFGPDTTDVGAQMVATAESLEKLAASPAAPAQHEGGDSGLRNLADAMQREHDDGRAPWLHQAEIDYLRAFATRPAPAQQAVNPVQWLRDNYDAYPNIASLCDAMTAALASNAAKAAEGVE